MRSPDNVVENVVSLGSAFHAKPLGIADSHSACAKVTTELTNSRMAERNNRFIQSYDYWLVNYLYVYKRSVT